MSQKAFTNLSIARFGHNASPNCTGSNAMPETIWIERSAELEALAQELSPEPSIGLDTEFLRERTFFPKLCLLQLAAGGRVWCVDTLQCGSLEPLAAVLTRAGARKVIHSARQDLEAFYLTMKGARERVISPVFDTQIAAACIGFKPQTGYAELVKSLLGVTLVKGQTRTDWSRRPLTPAQLEYAADDVAYLNEAAALLTERLRKLGREDWVLEDCRALENERLYDPDPADAWKRLRSVRQLPQPIRARAQALAVWRERTARERDLPRGWILSDEALFKTAEAGPATPAALAAALAPQKPLNDSFTRAVLETLGSAGAAPAADSEPARDSRPTPEQKAKIERLARVVDARAAKLGVSAEILAPRGELKALAMGNSEIQALKGWRQAEIGNALLEALG
jgi:ribonuclease D